MIIAYSALQVVVRYFEAVSCMPYSFINLFCNARSLPASPNSSILPSRIIKVIRRPIFSWPFTSPSLSPFPRPRSTHAFEISHIVIRSPFLRLFRISSVSSSIYGSSANTDSIFINASTCCISLSWDRRKGSFFLFLTIYSAMIPKSLRNIFNCLSVRYAISYRCI